MKVISSHRSKNRAGRGVSPGTFHRSKNRAGRGVSPGTFLRMNVNLSVQIGCVMYDMLESDSL